MPSPLGHALAGATAGLILAGPVPAGRAGSQRLVRTAILFGIIGMLPDLDLLTGVHRGPTHALGAAVIVGLVALVGRRGRFGLAVAAAWASHALLDWLGTDSSAPIGIMALWPLSSAYYESPFHVFQAISRRYWLEGFWDHNLRAVAREVLILGPPAAVVWWFRVTRPAGGPRVREGRIHT